MYRNRKGIGGANAGIGKNSLNLVRQKINVISESKTAGGKKSLE
jgi:hypothetical protein